MTTQPAFPQFCGHQVYTELTTAMLGMSASSSPFGINRPTSKVPAIRVLVSESVFECIRKFTNLPIMLKSARLAGFNT